MIWINSQGLLGIADALSGQLLSIPLRRVEPLVTNIGKIRQGIGVVGVFLQSPFEVHSAAKSVASPQDVNPLGKS
jgi:hypothetical protein